MGKKLFSIFDDDNDESKDEFEDEICESCGEWYGDCDEEDCDDDDCKSFG